MTADVDDEALRWDGDSDPSYVPVAPKGPVSTGSTADPLEPPPMVEPPPEVEPVETSRTASFLLVTYGILAGAYLIYTIGWLVPILAHDRPATPDVLGEFMVRLAQVLAIASPAIWYGATFFLTRHRRAIVRLIALLGGLVVLLPWPYLLLGA